MLEKIFLQIEKGVMYFFRIKSELKLDAKVKLYCQTMFSVFSLV